MPHIITSLTKITPACPTQWIGKTLENKEVYIRYRFGRLSIRIDGLEVDNSCIGEDLDGLMSNEELINYLKENSSRNNLSIAADLQL